MIFKSYIAESDDNFFQKNNSILFYGENIGIKNLFKRKIMLNKKTVSRFSQEEILKNKDSFYNDVLNQSLFDESKIFIIDNANDKILDTIKEIETKLINNKIYVFSDILDKKSKLRSYFEKSKDFLAIPCYKDSILDIKKIVKNELKTFKTLNVEQLNIIAENCNYDRDKLYNEIEKIKIYFTDLKINTDKLSILLNLKINNDFNKVKDEAFNGNKLNLNSLLSETTLDESKNIIYLSLLNQRLRKLSDILKDKSSTSIETLLDKQKPPIFWKDRPIISGQLKKWNLKKINSIIKKLYNLELKIKSSSSINHSLLIKKLLVDICLSANYSS